MRPLNLKRIAAQLQTHVEKKCGKKMLKNIACASSTPSAESEMRCGPKSKFAKKKVEKIAFVL